MSIEIKVPSLGESVSEATVARWLKNVGDAVAQDEPVVELETDKVTLEVPAPAAGVLSSQVVASGETVGLNAVLALMDEGAAPVVSSAPPKADAPVKTPTPAAVEKPAPTIAPSPAPAQAQASSSAVTLSPAVRRLVEENNLDPALIPATGKDGRLTKGDVLVAIEKGLAKAGSVAAPTITAAPSAPRPRVDDAREERVPMTRLRKVIAQRLKDAQNSAAMLTTFNEVDMSAVMALRAEYKDDFEKTYGVRLGFMSFFVRAAIEALKEFPAVNAEIHGDDIIYKNFYNIGVAVGTSQGLVVPVLKDADAMSFAETEATINAFGKKAKDGQLSMDDMSGGTFTISNGGVYGSMMSTPILNLPQSGILGMHNIQKRAVVISGKSGDEIVIRPMMYLALSYDHRIIDGREAVSFLVRIKSMIEDPRRLLLGL
ncbi:2-oxoglutarate dehydrogenase complex dihydrolipoyllysine-residue succinyltransferase [Alphaproteobacteria bacterium LSUCC0684]